MKRDIIFSVGLHGEDAEREDRRQLILIFISFSEWEAGTESKASGLSGTSLWRQEKVSEATIPSTPSPPTPS